MTTLLLSLAILASIAAHLVTPPYNHDHAPDRIQTQDRLHDGSCK